MIQISREPRPTTTRNRALALHIERDRLSRTEQARKIAINGSFTTFQEGHGQFCCVTRNASSADANDLWRVTHFDSAGWPKGHECYPSWDAAAESATRYATHLNAKIPSPPVQDGSVEELVNACRLNPDDPLNADRMLTLVLIHRIEPGRLHFMLAPSAAAPDLPAGGNGRKTEGLVRR